MKFLPLLLFSLCFVFPSCSFAQGMKTPFVLSKKIQNVLGKKVRQAVLAQRKGYVGLLSRRPYTAQLVGRNVGRAMVQVVNVADGSFHSGGFVFEEFFRGQRSVWAAIPYHTSGSRGETVYLRFFNEDGSSFVEELSVSQGGGWGINSLDVSLVKLPPELADKVFALRLSDQGASVGESACGYGFMCVNKGQTVPQLYHRNITDVTGFRLTGDYQLPPAPSGFCGAPIISQGGYVLGMHCGSEKGKQTFAVSSAGIKELLRSFYFGYAAQKVKILGKEVFEIEASQSIASISWERGGRLLERVDMDHFRRPFTYAQAEKVFCTGKLQKGDVIIFDVVSHGRIEKVIEYQVGE